MKLTYPCIKPILILDAIVERYPFCGNLIGGHALQVGTREGFLRYKFLVLRKGADSIAAPG